MKFKIIGKTFENPIIEAENAKEAVIQFATNIDTNMNLYFEAIPAKECEPLVRISDIEWDTDGDKDALAELPTSVDLNEFIEEDNVVDYLSDEYGYCVKNFAYEDNTYNSAEAFTGISEYHNADEATTRFEKLKKALFEAGTEAIEKFLGYELGADTIDKIMDEIIMQMPDDIFDEFYSKCVTNAEVEPETEAETNPDLLADIYFAYYENGKKEEREFFDINNFFGDLNTDRLSFPKPSAELHEVKMNGKELYPADFAQLLLILGYEDNMKDDKSSVAVAKASVMHDKSYYLNKFKDKYAKCEKEVRNEAWQEGVEYDSSYAQERFDEECNAEDIVGYYINYEGDDALKTWRENIEGRVITDEIREVTRILEYLYDSETYALSAKDILSVLVASMPKDSSEFNSQYHGEPNHLMNLPNGRTLKIIAGDSSAEEANYTWVVVGSEIEQASNPSNNLDCRYFGEREYILAIETSDDLEYDTVYSELEWAIRVASETPKYEEKKPKFSVGDEVRYTKTDVFCYVVKVPDDGGLRLYDTCNDSVIVLSYDELDSLVLEGHSEMAEKVFS